MAEFAIFDRDLQKRARRGSAPPPLSRSVPRSTALVTYNPKPEERSKRQSVSQVVEVEDLGTSSSPRLAFVRHKGENDYLVKETRPDPGYNNRALAFEQAAGILFYTLRKATLFCEDFATSFKLETQSLRHWCPRKTIDSLWRVKTDWNGVPFEDSEYDLDPKGNGSIEHYNRHIMLLRQAWDDLKFAKPVSREVFESSRPRLSTVEIKTAVKKLRATFQLIEELWEAVRADRTQMRSLIHQLRDGMDALQDIEAVWNRAEHGSRRSSVQV